MQIFEAVPNISEGRDLDVIAKCKAAITSTPEVQLLSTHSDIDHNRSVFTYIGTFQGIKQASLKLIYTATGLIDLSRHEGVHPFNGAVDVLPIIPVLNANMTEAVKLARVIGEAARQKSYQVYYYELADEQGISLPKLREQLKKKKPVGQGSLIVGARDFLVAYNFNLKNASLAEAKQLAKELREKDGGLKSVRALGLELKSRKMVQVSLNLINPFHTTPQMAYNELMRIIEDMGRKDIIVEEELVGMLPETVQAEARNWKD